MNTEDSVSVHDRRGLESLRRRWRLDPHRITRFRTHFYKKSLPFEEAAAALSPVPEEAIRNGLRPGELSLWSRHDSKIDGASKLVLQTRDGHLIETVILRIRSGRTALCVSSQIGCAVDCSFCATGRMGITRNLTAWEIVDQVALANRILRDEERRVRNLVFMGMGEPLQNAQQVDKALDLLTDTRLFNMAPGHLTVSTVGLPAPMVTLAHKRPAVHIALSLHSAREEVRRTLIPMAQKHSLDELHQTTAELNRLQNRPVMIEYLMLQGINDQPGDLAALLEWCRGLDVHLNLIPFNAVEGEDSLSPTPRAEREAFGAALRSHGIQTTLRYSLGADVMAACGQLIREEKRRR